MICLKGYLLGKVFNVVFVYFYVVFLLRNGKCVLIKWEILVYIGDKWILWWFSVFYCNIEVDLVIDCFF